MSFGSDIARSLGVSTNRILMEKENQSDSIASTTLMYNAIYVYTDIIENQNTGDFKVPLLRIVPVTSKYGDVCCVKYDKPHFVKLNRANIQTIEINLTDDTGELISLIAGKSVVTLVFRRRIANFFD